MDLLEREAALEELDAALDAAARAEGLVALVSGEAGIGKTALIEQFVRRHRSERRVLWGACDALFTPRPFGPLHDMSLMAMLHDARDRGAVFSGMLAELQDRPAIAVFEDVHWADEATLDLLRYLGRRIAQTTALLVLTYRDDEIGATHPLRTVLGDLASSSVSLRIPLSPLSELAVRVLVGRRSIDVPALHRQTGGNPFFVTEVLSGTGDGLPLTVRDAVLGRVARLSASAQTVVEAAAVVGPRIEPWLLADMVPSDAHAADECLIGGVLVAQGDGLAFRHELARQAVLESIASVRLGQLHRCALEALRSTLGARPGQSEDLRRLAHHAEGAADRQAILTYAPAAAREASAAGAHRAAAALFGLALRCTETLEPADRAALLEAHAWECFHIADLARVITSRRQAVELWREAGNPLKQGECLALLAGACFIHGRRDEARQATQSAIDLLEALPPGRELAMAYNAQAMHYHLANHDLADAIALATRAAALGEQAGDARIRASAYSIVGLATMFDDYEAGCDYLERARAVAYTAGQDASVGSAFANLSSTSIELFHLDAGERYLAEGLAYSADRDLDRTRLYMVGWLAIGHVYRGRWDDAAIAAAEVLRSAQTSTNARWAALVALGRLQARRGDAVDMPQPLDEALQLAMATREYHIYGSLRAARAEAAWMAGDMARCLEETDAAYPHAVAKQHHWVAGELAFWRWRAGASDPPPGWIAEPFALQIAGDWHAAAVAWRQLGCPYETARALADGDATAREEALLMFDALGARPAVAELRRSMRAQGVAHLPRGPRPSTRANRFGLTTRQVEILSLLAEGLSNAEIGDRLSIAPKTAEHHVAAVLAKLDVTSRRAAVKLASGERLIGQT